MNPEDYKMWCYFAGMAMQGAAARGDARKPDRIAVECFKMADAMMKERDRKNPQNKESK